MRQTPIICTAKVDLICISLLTLHPIDLLLTFFLLPVLSDLNARPIRFGTTLEDNAFD